MGVADRAEIDLLTVAFDAAITFGQPSLCPTRMLDMGVAKEEFLDRRFACRHHLAAGVQVATSINNCATGRLEAHRGTE